MIAVYQVMIVDDKDIVKRELKRLKIWGETSGFSISEEACHGQEALDILANRPIDLIITDIKMPKVDGIELLRTVVENKLCSCVVLLSDYSEFSYARQGIILGAFDYISKPVNENDLRCLLLRAKEYLDHLKQEKERVRKLEDLNSEKYDQYIQPVDIKKLTELLIQCDPAALSFTEHILDEIPEHDKEDLYKLEDIYKKAMQELVKGLFEAYPWIDKFIDISELITFRSISNQDNKTGKSVFVDKIYGLISLLTMLKCNILEKGIVGQVCKYVINHVENDISLVAVADTLYVNKTYLSEIFSQKIGISFTEYVSGVKMERAKILIRLEDIKSYEIAERLGFKDTEYFSKVFKKCTGMTPTEYRKKYER